MTTVINNPGNNAESADSAIGFVVVVILFIVIVALFFVYLLPMIRESGQPKSETTNIEVQLPANEEPVLQ